MKLTEAGKTLEGRGLKATLARGFPPAVGTVVAQRPAAGVKVRPGSIVMLTTDAYGDPSNARQESPPAAPAGPTATDAPVPSDPSNARQPAAGRSRGRPSRLPKTQRSCESPTSALPSERSRRSSRSWGSRRRSHRIHGGRGEGRPLHAARAGRHRGRPRVPAVGRRGPIVTVSSLRAADGRLVSPAFPTTLPQLRPAAAR